MLSETILYAQAEERTFTRTACRKIGVSRAGDIKMGKGTLDFQN